MRPFLPIGPCELHRCVFTSYWSIWVTCGFLCHQSCSSDWSMLFSHLSIHPKVVRSSPHIDGPPRSPALGTPVVILPGTWHYRVSAGTGWPGVSIQWLDEREGLTCNFYLSVAACKIVWAGPSLWDISMLLECHATNKQILQDCSLWRQQRHQL